MGKVGKSFLALLLSIFVAGCATTLTSHRAVEYDKKPVLIKENRAVTRNFTEERISNVEPDSYRIKAFVEEKSENNVKYDRLNLVERVIYEYDVKLDQDMIGTPSGPPRIEGKTERVIGRKTVSESGEKRETVYSFQPRAGIPVKFSSRHFKFENNLESIVNYTDGRGCAVASITDYPLLWRASEAELISALGNNLKDQIKEKAIRERVMNSIKIKEEPFDVKIETVKKDSIANDENGQYYSEVNNDKKDFWVRGYQLDLDESYKYVQELIMAELKERFISCFRIMVRDYETHMPIDNAIITLKQKNTLPIEKVLVEEESIRRRYFVEGSEFYKGTHVDVSSIIITDEGQKSVPSGGIELLANLGSSYYIEVTHPQYNFLNEELILDRKSDSKIFELIELGSKIRMQQIKGEKGRMRDAE